MYARLQILSESVRSIESFCDEMPMVCFDSTREFTIECQGVGVLPPLSLSSTVIHLPATPINDQSIAVFYVENRHLDKNHFKHPVPRIGNGELHQNVRTSNFVSV